MTQRAEDKMDQYTSGSGNNTSSSTGDNYGSSNTGSSGQGMMGRAKEEFNNYTGGGASTGGGANSTGGGRSGQY